MRWRNFINEAGNNETKKIKKLVGGIITVIIVAGLVVWFVQAKSYNRNVGGRLSLNQSIPVSVNPNALALQDDIVQVVKKVKPAVVEITTEKTVTYRYWNPFGQNNFFGNFFGQSTPSQPKTYQRKEKYLGSGFIVSPNGYILTNNHVVKGMDKIFVRVFGSDKKYQAKVIGTDSQTDLALLKINAGNNLPTVSLGNSNNVHVGQFAIAIGNPMGLYESVTFGIISAKGRYVSGMPLEESFIQTSAPINPGNSGGPLVNLEGQVVGINTFIIAPYVATNLGFAIPINTAKKIFIQLKEHGKVIRGFLGVFLQPLTSKLAKTFGLTSKKGALIASVIPGTPAKKAGLQSGDIILDFNGKPVKNIMELEYDVSNTSVGQTVILTIWRNKKKITVPLKVEERPSKKELTLASEYASGEVSWKGMTISRITNKIRQEYNIPDIKGVIVVMVEPGSIADQAGITSGVIIKKIDNSNITGFKEFQDIISKIKKNQDVSILIYANGQDQWVSLSEK
ncbi:MAG: Do family serine endopeptidase [Candidatus Omnitrophica bacterium]|jgi:serine protease Do|nr:Do family serine endopeptidase [Candidatus Omnitrophota bacterium]